MDIREIRENHPEYNDMSDAALAESLHSKHYSDLPFDEFAKKVNYKSSPKADIDKTTGLTNTPLRIKLSFVDKPEDRLKLLQSFYDDAGRLPDGRLVYKNPDTKKMTTIDEEGRSIRDLADWVGYLPEVTLGTAGAILGGIPGAGIGTLSGYGVKKGIGELITGEHTGLDPSDEEMKEYGAAFGAGMAGEAGGALVLKGLSPFAKKITPAMKESMGYFSKFGGKLTPAQATESRALDLLENVTENSIFGGGRFRTFRLEQDELLDSIGDDVIRRFGNSASPEEAGLLFQKALNNRVIAYKKAGDALYKRVDKVTQGTMVSTKQLKKEATKQLKKITPAEKLVPSLKVESTSRILKDFANLPDEVPFGHLQQWRSDLMQIGFAPTDLIPGKTAGMAKHLSKQIDNLFNQAEGGLTGDALDALKQANTFWKAGKEKYNTSLMKSLAKKEPAAVANTVFKPNVIEPIRAVKRIVSGETWKKVRGNYTSKLLLKDSVAPTGVINGSKLAANIRNMGKHTMDEIYSKVEQKELQQLAQTLKLVQNRPPTGGGMLIQLTQAGAILSLPAAVMTGSTSLAASSSAILLGPRALAMLFTREHGIKWLTKGLVQKRGTKEAIKLGARITALVGKENIIEQE